jgi:lipopolysaccharide/colanic/teichoic acid biosynthesis glycosyltransferase
MSIVGYRPTVREHYDAYPEYAKIKIYNSKPGLTGLGSIVFRNEEEILQNFEDKNYFHNQVIIPYKADLENWHIDNKSIKNYFKIIFTTVLVVIKLNPNIWKVVFKNLPPIPFELQEYI